jgi:hypothetical protein
MMFDLDQHMTEIETTFVSLETTKLIDLIKEIEKEAKACTKEDPKRAYRLLRACNIGSQILQRRIDESRNLQPRAPLD